MKGTAYTHTHTNEDKCRCYMPGSKKVLRGCHSAKVKSVSVCKAAVQSSCAKLNQSLCMCAPKTVHTTTTSSNGYPSQLSSAQHYKS